MIRADMHIHTYYSDGTQSPADVVQAARRKGVGLIAVTDHDNANGCALAAELAKKSGVKCVNGEEFSAYANDVKIHILGYAMNLSSPAMAAFNKRLKEGSEMRALDMLKKLSAVGVNISYGEVLRERKCKQSPIHSMYIAVAGARKGYASSPFAFYTRYLNYGAPAFSCVARPSPEETVEAIRESGGVSSLAHPGRISMDKEGVISLIERLLPFGLNGIEGVYSGHTVAETQYYKELAEKYGLLTTGGSDTHFSEGNRCVGVPEFYPDERLLSALKII